MGRPVGPAKQLAVAEHRRTWTSWLWDTFSFLWARFRGKRRQTVAPRPTTTRGIIKRAKHERHTKYHLYSRAGSRYGTPVKGATADRGSEEDAVGTDETLAPEAPASPSPADIEQWKETLKHEILHKLRSEITGQMESLKAAAASAPPLRTQTSSEEADEDMVALPNSAPPPPPPLPPLFVSMPGYRHDRQAHTSATDAVGTVNFAKSTVTTTRSPVPGIDMEKMMAEIAKKRGSLRRINTEPAPENPDGRSRGEDTFSAKWRSTFAEDSEPPPTPTPTANSWRLGWNKS